jgi:hypothetical protein
LASLNFVACLGQPVGCSAPLLAIALADDKERYDQKPSKISQDHTSLMVQSVGAPFALQFGRLVFEGPHFMTVDQALNDTWTILYSSISCSRGLPVYESNTLLNILHNALCGNELAGEALAGIEEQLSLDVNQYSRTDARNQFNRIIKQQQIAVITKHGRLDTASVIIPMNTFADLLVKVAQAARQRQDRVPFTAMFAGMTPVNGEVRCLELDTRHELHQLIPISGAS